MIPFGLPPALSVPVPADVASLAYPGVAVVQRANPAPHGWTQVVLKPGQTLSHLALTHRTTVAALAAKNRLTDADHVLAGQRFWVPRTTAAVSASRTSSASPARSKSTRPATYTVRRGDTISEIAARFRVTQRALLATNRLSPTAYIVVGQSLRIPATSTSTSRPAKRPVTRWTTYTVRPGDTVSALALRLRTTQAALVKANRLNSSAAIYVGQQLKVPVVATTRNSFAGRVYPESVVRAAEANRRYLATRPVPSRTETKALIVATARRHNVDPRLALAIAWQESGWNQRRVSVANAIGIMQVIPSSGVWASDLSGRRLDLLKPRDNVTAGVVILRALGRAAATREQAIAGYYQGLASVRRNGMFSDTRAYVANVLALRERM